MTGWRPPVSSPFSRDTIVPSCVVEEHLDPSFSLVYEYILFCDWVLSKRCSIKGRYDLDMMNIGKGRVRVKQDAFSEVNAIQWFSETLGIDLLDYFSNVFKGIYEKSNGYFYFTTEKVSALPIVISEPVEAYVLGIDYQKRRVQVKIRDARYKNGYRKRYYRIPDSEDDELGDLGVAWGAVLKSLALRACVDYHGQPALAIMRVANDRLRSDKMVFRLYFDERTVITSKQVQYNLFASIASARDIYFEVSFDEPTPFFLQKHSLVSGSKMIPFVDFVMAKVYYSPYRKQAILETDRFSTLVYLVGNGVSIGIDWANMWIMCVERLRVNAFGKHYDMLSYGIYTPILKDALRRAMAYEGEQT